MVKLKYFLAPPPPVIRVWNRPPQRDTRGHAESRVPDHDWGGRNLDYRLVSRKVRVISTFIYSIVNNIYAMQVILLLIIRLINI